jgi:hypothetical protein
MRTNSYLISPFLATWLRPSASKRGYVKGVRCRAEILENASKALPVTPLGIGRRKSDTFSISLI